ncbi:hypothetical protein [Butyrivibrio sp. JL13D10]|uniref:hypothetical protein n=1 Tax=Butyrivibrio sp. JL13D10 TaxID=3236815 RepID=UPI0038B680B2
MKNKILTNILILFFVVASFCITHIPLSVILHINTDDVTEAECTWYKEDATKIFVNQYAKKTYRLYFGEIGSTAQADISLYHDGHEISKFTDLGSLGLISHDEVIFQERGCYADEGIRHIKNTIASAIIFTLPPFLLIILVKCVITNWILRRKMETKILSRK